MEFKGTMVFKYGDKGLYPGIESTFEAIQKGLRTSTTRLESQGHIDYWKKAKVGDIIEFSDGEGNTVDVVVTRPIQKLSELDMSTEEWMKKEGWNKEFADTWLAKHYKEAWQMEYELLRERNERLISEDVDSRQAKSFRGDRYFLSNMYPCKVTLGKWTFDCAEAAFQAGKCKTKREVEQFIGVNGATAKRLGKQIAKRDDWATFRVEHMQNVLFAKFEQNEELANLLRETGREELVEYNSWNDTFWGVCGNTGENMLGRLLMKVRSFI